MEVGEDKPYVWGKLVHQCTVRFDSPRWADLMRLCALERIEPAEALRRLYLRAIDDALAEAEQVARVRRAVGAGRGGPSRARGRGAS